LAYNFYATPETTHDVDFLVRLRGEEGKVSDLLQHLAPQGYQVEPLDVGHWMYRVHVKGQRIDLVDPLYFKYTRRAEIRRRSLRLKKIGTLFILSPEDLVVLHLAGALDAKKRNNADMMLKNLTRAVSLFVHRVKVGDFDENYFLERAQEHGDQVYSQAVLLLRRKG